jgi:site-specific DNA recombinase
MRKKSRGQSEVRRQEFPLRTLLVCPRCGRFLTGSASKSRTGDLHHYYHCQLKYHCTFRVRASVAHGKLEEYFGSFKIQPEVKRLYRKILEKKFESMNSQKDTDLKNIKSELLEYAQRVSSLNEKFVADQIDVDTYSTMKKKFDDEVISLKARETIILNQESDFQIYMKKGITLVDNLKRFYQEATLEIKQKIVSSIFPEKLVFDENSYRTSRVNEAFLLLTKTINELQGQKNKNATVSDGVFKDAPPPGLEPGTP